MRRGARDSEAEETGVGEGVVDDVRAVDVGVVGQEVSADSVEGGDDIASLSAEDCRGESQDDRVFLLP